MIKIEIYVHTKFHNNPWFCRKLFKMSDIARLSLYYKTSICESTQRTHALQKEKSIEYYSKRFTNDGLLAMWGAYITACKCNKLSSLSPLIAIHTNIHLRATPRKYQINLDAAFLQLHILQTYTLLPQYQNISKSCNIKVLHAYNLQTAADTELQIIHVNYS